jgi:lipopolysaccharide export system permease protein
MFFIGAPLGSIIRKGGLGLPIVFAVSIFIVFHFINTFGKRVAQENEMSAFMGVWMSSLILTPLAILLTYRAINDIGGMVSFDGMLDPLKKTLVFQKIKSLFINSSEKEEITDESIAVAEKFTVVYPKELIAEYQKITKFALALYAVTLAIALLLIKINTVLVLILGAIALLAFLYFIFKAQKKLEEIEIQIHKKIEPGIWISLLVAFPFYIILYLYTKKELSKLLTTNN